MPLRICQHIMGTNQVNRRGPLRNSTTVSNLVGARNPRDATPSFRPQRLRELIFPSLVYRKASRDMIETYQLIHGLVDSHQCMPLKLEGRYTRGPCLKLKKRFCRTTETCIRYVDKIFRSHQFQNK